MDTSTVLYGMHSSGTFQCTCEQQAIDYTMETHKRTAAMHYQYLITVLILAIGILGDQQCDGKPMYNGYNGLYFKDLGGYSWKDCSTSSKSAQVSSLSISPSPVVKGSSATVEIMLGFSEEVSGGSVTVVMKYKGWIPVKTTTANICNLNTDSCPFETGTHTLTFTSKIPSYTLSGTYTGLVTAVDQDDQELLCINISGMKVQ